jgi:LysR family transcriptional activator of nhaA
VLTEAGRLALGYADQIFLLGEQMQEALNVADSGRIRLTVGVSDSLPKLSAYRMLEPAMGMEKKVHLVCYEDQFETLLAELALHRLDIVLTDREVPSGSAMKVFSHRLYDSEMLVVGTHGLVERYRDGFPQNLNSAPFLLPARNNALRGKIDEWFLQHRVHPDIVGEFEDNALLNTFGRRGLGLFFAPAGLAAEIAEQFQATEIGRASGVREQFFAISNDRKIKHPAVEAILAVAQKGMRSAA